MGHRVETPSPAVLFAARRGSASGRDPAEGVLAGGNMAVHAQNITGSFSAPGDAAEAASLRRDVARLTDRTKDLEIQHQNTERDHALKLRVKDDLLRKLHEDLQTAHRNTSSVAEEPRLRASLQEADVRIAELMDLVAHKQADFERVLKQNMLHAKEMEARDAEHEARVARLVSEVASLEQRLKMQAMEDKTQELAVVLQSLRGEVEKERDSFRVELDARDRQVEELAGIEACQMREIGNLEASIAATKKAAMESDTQLQLCRKTLQEAESVAAQDKRRAAEAEAKANARELELHDALLRARSLEDQVAQHASRASNLNTTLEQERMMRNDEASKGHTKVRDVSSVLSRVEQEKQALDAELARVRLSECSLRDEVNDLRQNLAGVTASLETERSKAMRRSEELSRATKDTQHKLESERDTLRLQWEVEREELMSDLEAAKAAQRNAEASLGQLGERNEKLVQQRDAEREKARQSGLEKEADYNTKFEAVQARVAEMESEVQVLRYKLLQAASDFQQERNDFIRAHEAERARTEDQLKILQGRLHAAANANDEADAKSNVAQGEVSLLRVQLRDKDDEITRLQRANERVKDLIAKERQTHQREAEASQEKLSVVNRDLLEAQSQLIDLQGSVQQGHDEKKTVELEAGLLKEALHATRAQLQKEREEYHTQKRAAAEEKGKESAKVLQLKQAVADLEAERSGLHKVVAMKEQEAQDELQRRNLLVEGFEKGLKAREQEVKADTERAAALRRKSDEDKQLVAGQRDKLQGQYLDSQREITRLEALNAEKDMRMEVLQHELGTTQALTQSVHPLREELQALQDDRAGLERKLAQRQQDAAQLRVAVETRVHGMKEKMVLLQDDINRLTGENATLQVRIAAMREPDSPLFSSHAAAVRP